MAASPACDFSGATRCRQAIHRTDDGHLQLGLARAAPVRQHQGKIHKYRGQDMTTYTLRLLTDGARPEIRRCDEKDDRHARSAAQRALDENPSFDCAEIFAEDVFIERVGPRCPDPNLH
jgi:hypothetical protein